MSTLDLSRATATPAPVNLTGLTRGQLTEALKTSGVVDPAKAKMRANQMWRWMHNFGVTDFERMTDIAEEMFADPQIRYIHVRSATNNCYHCRIDRA